MSAYYFSYRPYFPFFPEFGVALPHAVEFLLCCCDKKSWCKFSSLLGWNSMGFFGGEGREGGRVAGGKELYVQYLNCFDNK